MTDEGWVKQHRSIFKHWVADDHRAFHLWAFLIAEVNYTEGKTMVDGKTIKVNPGQTITSIDKLSKQVKITWKKTKDLIDEFSNDGMIKVKKVGRCGMLLTVCNYEKYQDTMRSEREEQREERRDKRREEQRENDRDKRREYKKDKKDFKKDKEQKKGAPRRLNLWEGAPEE